MIVISQKREFGTISFLPPWFRRLPSSRSLHPRLLKPPISFCISGRQGLPSWIGEPLELIVPFEIDDPVSMVSPQKLSLSAVFERWPPGDASLANDYDFFVSAVPFGVHLLDHFETDPLFVVVLEDTDPKLFLGCFSGNVMDEFTALFTQRRGLRIYDEIFLNFTLDLLNWDLGRWKETGIRVPRSEGMFGKRGILRMVEPLWKCIVGLARTLRFSFVEGRRLANLHKRGIGDVTRHRPSLIHHWLIFIATYKNTRQNVIPANKGVYCPKMLAWFWKDLKL